MNVLIVEDETAAATNLKALLLQIDPSIRIEAVIETVVETVRWVKDNPLPDLIFMDIHLADGQAFKIFEQIDIECPIVFTTAYDRYALDAFKVNSIDYILKPIKKEELRRAFDKLRRLSAPQVAEYVEQTNRFVTSRSRGFLIPFRDKLVPLTPEAENAMRVYFTDLYNRRERNFANAREVNNYFDRVKKNQSSRLRHEMERPDFDPASYSILLPEDMG